MADRNKKGEFLPAHSEPGPGRDSLYDASMNEQARKLALLGLTDAEMAEFFGVTERTLNNWKIQFPAFFHSITDGKVVADANVAESLYKRATGEVVLIEKAYRNKQTGDVQVVKLSSFIPGDPTAQRLWLTNRRRRDWVDKQTTEHTGSVELVSKEQRDAAVAAATRADR